MITLGSAIALGLGAGFISGTLGVGGGIILVPALIVLFDLSAHKAIGISLAIIVPTALVGALRHYYSGNVDLQLALPIIAGGLIGGYVGAWSTTFLSGDTLKRVFAVFLILVGVNMLFNLTGRIRGG